MEDPKKEESTESVWDEKFPHEIVSVDKVLDTYVPEKAREEVRKIMYGTKAQSVVVPDEALSIAEKFNFEIAGYKIAAQKEQLRAPRVVRIGAVQNAIKTSTTAPVAEQRNLIYSWLREVAHAAHLAGVNILAV